MGFGLVAFSLALFAYYTLWIVVLVRGRAAGLGARPGTAPGWR